MGLLILKFITLQRILGFIELICTFLFISLPILRLSVPVFIFGLKLMFFTNAYLVDLF